MSIISVKNCNTQEIYKNSCPSSTKCVEHQPGVFNGICQCKEDGYVFNSKFTNNDDYCTIIDDETKQIRNNNNNFEKSGIGSRTNAPHEEKLKSSAQPHHIIAGVLIPIVLIVIVIGLVHIIRHVRRSHGRGPFYEDVMLDHDDPPLI